MTNEEEGVAPESVAASPNGAGRDYGTIDSNGVKRKRRIKSPSNLDAMMQQNRLSTTNLNFRIPTQRGAQEIVDDNHGEESSKAKMLKFLHSTKVQMFLMALLFFDVIILFMETFLLASYPACHTIERDCIACCHSEEVDDHVRILAEEEHGNDDHGICEVDFEPEGEAACDPHKWSGVHTTEAVLFWFTIVILATFLVELHVEVFALGPRVFFRQFFYVLDYVIVTVSMALELSFHFSSDEALQSLVGLLVFARIWRFVRIGHGIVEITAEWTHHQYQELLDYAESLETKLTENKLPLPEAPKTIRREHGSAHP